MLSAFLMKKGKPLESEVSRADMLQALRDKDSLLWVDLEDPSEFENECLVEIFNFHPLTVEDCLSERSDPKVDEYEEYLFLVLHAVGMKYDEEKQTEELVTSELHIFFGKNYVVTYHKDPMRAVTQVREATRRRSVYMMGQGADMLVHTLVDHLVDNYQPIVAQCDEKIDCLEEGVFNNPPEEFLSTLMQTKQDIFNLRRVVAPQRDTVNYIARHATPFIRRKNIMYFRDVYDHLMTIYGMAEGYHESLSNIFQCYFSYSSHRLNEVMKRLTVLATLCMPIVILASIYGMNFIWMPFLKSPYGFSISIFIMGMVTVGMLGWMKMKKWI